jgi:hypothetical protein
VPPKYPIYGPGPGTKAIFDRYYGDDYQQAVSQLGFLVVNIDNRGLLRRGKAFEAAGHGKLGQTDVEDLVASPPILPDGPTWTPAGSGSGASYGGHISIMALLEAPERCFRSRPPWSPGTDWKELRHHYTERYMGHPLYNAEGYEKASPLNYVKNLKGKLLIQHGAVDDNAHPTHTMQLVEARILGVRLLLQQETHLGLCAHGFLCACHGLLALDGNRHDHAGEQHHVAHWQDDHHVRRKAGRRPVVGRCGGRGNGCLVGTHVRTFADQAGQ